MDKYKVKINLKAIRELDHIYEYIANEKLHRKTKEILHRKIIRISMLKNVDFYTGKPRVAFFSRKIKKCYRIFDRKAHFETIKRPQAGSILTNKRPFPDLMIEE